MASPPFWRSFSSGPCLPSTLPYLLSSNHPCLNPHFNLRLHVPQMLSEPLHHSPHLCLPPPFLLHPKALLTFLCFSGPVGINLQPVFKAIATLPTILPRLYLNTDAGLVKEYQGLTHRGTFQRGQSGFPLLPYPRTSSTWLHSPPPNSDPDSSGRQLSQSALS